MVALTKKPDFLVPADGLLMEVSETRLMINNQEVGTATLYITDHNVVWAGGEGANGVASPPIQLLYSDISVHAVEMTPYISLLLLVNFDLRVPGMDSPSTGGGDAPDDENNSFDGEETTTLVRFIPQQESQVEAMFAALNHGQVLNPDPIEGLGEAAGGDDDYMDGEDGEDEFEDAEESNMTAEDAVRLFQQMNLNKGHPHNGE